MNLNEILIQIPKKLPEYRQRNNSNNSKDPFWKTFMEDLKKEISSLVNDDVFTVEASLGMGNISTIPWVTVYHNQVTKSAQNGFYIAYLFSEDGSEVHVTLMLGAQQSQVIGSRDVGKKSLDILEEAAQEFRSTFQHCTSENERYLDQITLQHDKDNLRVDSYEKGAVFSKTYSLDNLDVDDTTIQSDLDTLLELYKSIQQDLKHTFFLPVHPDEPDRYTIWDKLYQKYNSPFFNPTTKKAEQSYDLPDPTLITPTPPPSKHNTKGSHGYNNKNRDYGEEEIGRIGENYVYDCEIAALKKLGKSDLADRVVKQYEDKTNYPGYDIKSFDKTDFEEIYIEVKSSAGNSKESFEITRNEWKAAEKYKERYWIYTVLGCDPPGKNTRKVQKRFKDPAKILSSLKEPTKYEVKY